jgi:hypothetical protein
MKGIVHCGAHHGEVGCGSCRRCQALAGARLRLPETELRLPVVPQHTMPGFSLDAPKRRRGESARSREVDRLLEQLGLGRR